MPSSFNYSKLFTPKALIQNRLNPNHCTFVEFIVLAYFFFFPFQAEQCSTGTLRRVDIYMVCATTRLIKEAAADLRAAKQPKMPPKLLYSIASSHSDLALAFPRISGMWLLVLTPWQRKKHSAETQGPIQWALLWLVHPYHSGKCASCHKAPPMLTISCYRWLWGSKALPPALGQCHGDNSLTRGHGQTSSSPKSSCTVAAASTDTAVPVLSLLLLQGLSTIGLAWQPLCLSTVSRL